MVSGHHWYGKEAALPQGKKTTEGKQKPVSQHPPPLDPNTRKTQAPVRTEEQLRKRFAYEKMLARISKNAVKVKSLDLFLAEFMEDIGTVMDVSRAFICVSHPPTSNFTCTHEWTAPNAESMEDLDALTMTLPWVYNQLKNGQILNFEHTEHVQGEHFREYLSRVNAASTLLVPLFIKEKLYGFFGFDECRHPRKWLEEDLYILTTAGQILTRTIENKRYEDELIQQKNRLECIFSSVQDGIITVDTELNIIEANSAVSNICGMAIANEIPFNDASVKCAGTCIKDLRETLFNKTTIQDHQIECRHNDRDKQTVVISSFPLLDGSKKFLGAVMVIRDITRIINLENELRDKHHFHNIIGKSEKIQEVYDLIKVLADQETTVLVTGESGSGKEIVARALHYTGTRASAPFVAVNCSALAENLLESELFGHVKGAFTGAAKNKIGRFEAAEGGTILLDEIGDISPLIQLKLLRILQEKEFERVGETKPRQMNVRVIASTNRDLRLAVNLGKFRQDLYYRLNIIEIKLPALRERYDDIPLLINHFCTMFNKRYSKSIRDVAPELLNKFMRYSWPGNVRELAHALERAFVLCQGPRIELEHIPSDITNGVHDPNSSSHAMKKRKEPTSELLFDVLQKTDWNVSKASRLMGISRCTMYRWLKNFNIDRPTNDM
jgi:two-component system, NtrC family, response regulator HydG